MIRLTVTMVSALMLTACSINMPTPAPQEERSHRDVPAELPTGPRLPPAPERDEAPVEISTETYSESYAAESELLQQARDLVSEGHAAQGAAVAERVLGMNVRNAEAYEVMAEAYSIMGQGARAAQIARKGLRYTETGSYQAERLMEYLR